MDDIILNVAYFKKKTVMYAEKNVLEMMFLTSFLPFILLIGTAKLLANLFLYVLIN